MQHSSSSFAGINTKFTYVYKSRWMQQQEIYVYKSRWLQQQRLKAVGWNNTKFTFRKRMAEKHEI